MTGFIISFLVIFTSFGPSVEVQYSYGYFYILMIISAISGNTFFIVKDFLKKLNQYRVKALNLYRAGYHKKEVREAIALKRLEEAEQQNRSVISYNRMLKEFENKENNNRFILSDGNQKIE